MFGNILSSGVRNKKLYIRLTIIVMKTSQCGVVLQQVNSIIIFVKHGYANKP